MRNDDRTESALLFVPDDARAFLRGRIEDYGRDPGNHRRPDLDKFESIETVRAAEGRALFTADVDLAAPGIMWWELWVRQPTAISDRLAELARGANLDVHADRLVFPDTTVLFVHAAAGALATFVARLPGAVTEIRKATGTIEPFLERGDSGLGQRDWVAELAGRVTPPAGDAPVVCALDTGVSAAHPLIVRGLAGAWAYDAAWGTDDHHPDGGHGTPLTGLVLYGDLETLMSGSQPIELTHGAESMKLLPPYGFPPTKPPSYGIVTQGAVALVETERPGVPRTFCLATTAADFSRGSQSLPEDLTPIKPEVLFEAGNMLSDTSGFCAWGPSVSLLAPGSDVEREPLVPFWATSAAAGMAGNFIGRLQAALPARWPETHRALAVDSANWPQPIRRKLVGHGVSWKSGSKAEKQQILREVGYGVPDIERAILSASNDVTLVAETEIQPFTLGADGRSGVFNEMHFYDLPWPRTALERLENEIVTMKITLSYFVEPNLTGKAATRPDTYRSFGLRFDMKKRTETDARFKSRISASQAKDGTEPQGEKSYWLLGPKAIQAGSLHCDVWRGPAVELAGHDAIAVYPVGGWWKSHVGQRRVSDRSRYALVISISAPGHSVDLYSEVAALVEVKELEVSIR